MSKSACERKKILLIGWDGADWQHINPLLDAGLMPGLESLVNRGVIGNLATLQPILSPMLWTSIATGKTADKHGIHGFVEPFPDRSGVRPSTSTSRKTKAIWNILNQNGWSSNVVSWWASFPAEPINGNIITNLYNATKRNAKGEPQIGLRVIHPNDRAHELADLKVDISEITEDDIGPFCPKYSQVDQEKDKRLATLAKLLSDCASIQSVSTHLMETSEWDFMAIYFDSIDHFCHAFMPYHPPKMVNVSESDFEIYNGIISTAYRWSDMMLQRLIDLAGPETTVILCSDHGFQSGAGRPLVTPMEPAGPALWHRSHGILIMAGAGIKKDERIYGANIIDITPTILHLAGLPVGADMDGRVLTEAFESTESPEFVDSWDEVEGDSGMHPAGFDIFNENAEKQDDLIKQFVALGYIEDPGNNKEQAAENASIELKYNLARVFYSTNRFEEALPLFQELVTLSPWEDRFWKNLAYCCYEMKQYSAAEKIIRELYRDSERVPPFSKLILAQCAWERGAKNESLEWVHQLLNQRHRVANVYGTLGQFLVSRVRDYQLAERAFEACRSNDPDYALAYEGLAGVYYRTKRYEESIDSALHAVTLLYRLPKSHFFLGLALEKVGELDKATTAFERVLNFNFRKYKILALKRLVRIHNQTGDSRTAGDLQKEIRRLRRTPDAQNRTNIEINIPPIPPAAEREKTASERRNIGKKRATKPSGKEFLIVSGLPRSGTSLMMQMLKMGGIEPHSDGLRSPDENNPQGYYEWEDIKKIGSQPELLDDPAIEGRVIKVISMLIPVLPAKHQYRVIFLTRPIEQIAASQAKMIDRLATEGPDSAPEKLTERLQAHRDAVLQLMESRDNFDFITVDYLDLISNPTAQVDRIAEFTGNKRLSPAKMTLAVRPELHREK